MTTSPKKLLNAVIAALEDHKAVDIKVLDVRKLTTFADYMVIASGRSSRQVKALSDYVAEASRHLQVRPLGIEGEQAAEWILVDLGDVVVHLMQAEARDFYQLEKLWAPPPKSLKPKATADA